MAKDDAKPSEDDSSGLVKFKRLPMRVVSASKDAVYDLDPKMKPKPKAAKKPAKKSRPKP
jgi:hypothetical protein